jgi:hypothetical protein
MLRQTNCVSSWKINCYKHTTRYEIHQTRRKAYLDASLSTTHRTWRRTRASAVKTRLLTTWPKRWKKETVKPPFGLDLQYRNMAAEASYHSLQVSVRDQASWKKGTTCYKYERLRHHKIRHIQMSHVFYVSHAVLLMWLKEETGDALRIALQVHEGNHQSDANTCQRYW